MSIEEIIEKLEKLKVETGSLACFGCESEHHCSTQGCRLLREAIALLCTHPEAQPNEPLTLEELMEMDGQPVYLAEDRKWYIVSVNYETHQFKQPCGVDKWGGGDKPIAVGEMRGLPPPAEGGLTMVKYFCDLCGGSIIGGCNHGTCLSFNSFGASGGPHGIEYHFHPDCAREVIKRLGAMMETDREPVAPGVGRE